MKKGHYDVVAHARAFSFVQIALRPYLAPGKQTSGWSKLATALLCSIICHYANGPGTNIGSLAQAQIGLAYLRQKTTGSTGHLLF
jgi:hypothetical protein